MSTKENHDPNALTKALAHKHAIDAAIRRYCNGDADFAREVVETMGRKTEGVDLKDLLVELAGEACKAVARAVLRDTK